jgi:hypothetical protein
LAKEEAALGGPFFEILEVETEEPLYQAVEIVRDSRSDVYPRPILSERAVSGFLPYEAAEAVVRELREKESVVVQAEKARLQADFNAWLQGIVAKNREKNQARAAREEEIRRETPDPREFYRRVTDELPAMLPDTEQAFRGRGYYGRDDSWKREFNDASERLYAEQRIVADRVSLLSRHVTEVPEAARVREMTKALGWTTRGRDAVWEAALTLIDLGDPSGQTRTPGYLPAHIETTTQRFGREPYAGDRPREQARRAVELATYPAIPTEDRLVADGIAEKTGGVRHYPRTAYELRLTEKGRGVLEHIRTLLLPPKKVRGRKK